MQSRQWGAALRRAWAKDESGLRPIALSLGLTTMVAMAVLLSTWWILDVGTHGLKSTDPLASHLDLVKIALSVVAGVGGLVALVVTYRRQHVAEEAHRHTRAIEAEKARDAVERRVTELYAKAAEQLGSDKAPVRLAGMYALERLAEGNAEHRQTIVNVLCAYLRMPYTVNPPGRDRSLKQPLRPGRRPPPQLANTDRQRHREEREVRLTAQHIIAKHLRYPAATGDDIEVVPSGAYWPDIDIDLAEATLIDFDLNSCRPNNGNFRNTTFTGVTKITGATFTGAAIFSEATFTEIAWFGDTTFTGPAWFNQARFANAAWFGATRFYDLTLFNGATFASDAMFSDAIFGDIVWFRDTAFMGEAQFDTAIVQNLAKGGHEHEWPAGWIMRSDPDNPTNGWLTRDQPPNKTTHTK